MLSSKIENRARMPSLTPVFNMILEVLVIAIKQEKKQNKLTNKIAAFRLKRKKKNCLYFQMT